MGLRPSALPPSRFAWFSSVIPFVTCHSTPRHTIRVRQNVANTCANHCNQAITIKNGDWQLDIGRITAIVKPTAVNCFWRLIDGVDAESSRSRCRLRVKRLRRVYPRTKGYSCVIGFVEELQRFGSECGQKGWLLPVRAGTSSAQGLVPLSTQSLTSDETLWSYAIDRAITNVMSSCCSPAVNCRTAPTITWRSEPTGRWQEL